MVAGSAIRPDNPELAAARAAGLPVLHRSEALAATMADDTVVTVAGTHGKSTTTSMITVLLQGAGLDPSFAIGANVPALGVNAAHGSSRIFVAEADESDGSFLNYRPQIAVVTNVEAGPPGLLRHRRSRLCLLRPLHGAAAGRRRPGRLRGRRRRAGPGPAHPGARQHPRRPLRDGRGRRRQAARRRSGPGVRISDCRRPVRRRHCRSRARTTRSTRPPPSPSPSNSASRPAAAGALAHFSGAFAPLRAKGEGRGVRVYDDYAHHPTEVRAALSAARAVAGEHKVHVLFQPHLFSRTREFAREFADALNAADTALVLDIYPAREDPIPGVTSAADRRRTWAPAGRLVGAGPGGRAGTSSPPRRPGTSC